MPEISSEVLAMLASLTTLFTQLIKGLIPEKYKDWIPFGIFVVLVPIGTLLALYYGRDPVAGALEGAFGFATAIGIYETAKRVPVAKAVFNGKGWIQPKS